MKKSRKILSLSIIAAAFGILSAGSLRLQAAETDTIAEGVYIGNTYVGGMTRGEAAAAVAAYAKTAGEAELTLTAGEREVTIKASELGLQFSDESAVQKAMDVGRSGNLIKRYKDKKDLEHGDRP